MRPRVCFTASTIDTLMVATSRVSAKAIIVQSGRLLVTKNVDDQGGSSSFQAVVSSPVNPYPLL